MSHRRPLPELVSLAALDIITRIKAHFPLHSTSTKETPHVFAGYRLLVGRLTATSVHML